MQRPAPTTGQSPMLSKPSNVSLQEHGIALPPNLKVIRPSDSGENRPPLMVLGNFPNGCVFLHEAKCFFQGEYTRKPLGYFNRDAMPWSAITHLCQGGKIMVIDGTHIYRESEMTHAQRFGVTTWTIVFNTALGFGGDIVADWATDDMYEVAESRRWQGYRNAIKRVAGMYGNPGPLKMQDQVQIRCNFSLDFKDPGILKFLAR